MKSTILWALAVLNVLLLALFLMRITRDNTAGAQARRPADYLMLPGELGQPTNGNNYGNNPGVVYVIDASNGLLTALSYDDSANRLDAMAPVSLGRTDPAAGRTPPGAPMRKP